MAGAWAIKRSLTGEDKRLARVLTVTVAPAIGNDERPRSDDGDDNGLSSSTYFLSSLSSISATCPESSISSWSSGGSSSSFSRTGSAMASVRLPAISNWSAINTQENYETHTLLNAQLFPLDRLASEPAGFKEYSYSFRYWLCNKSKAPLTRNGRSFVAAQL